jgi:hypothetical protein
MALIWAGEFWSNLVTRFGGKNVLSNLVFLPASQNSIQSFNHWYVVLDDKSFVARQNFCQATQAQSFKHNQT